MSNEEKQAYILVEQLAALVSEWLDHGYHLRDSSGQLIDTLDEWTAAARAGRWTARPLPVRPEGGSDER